MSVKAERHLDNWRLARWSLIVSLLLLPLVAMQFTAEVDWDGLDFAVAGALLVGAGTAYELAARRFDSRHRAVIGTALVVMVGLIWAQGAVGIF